MCVLAFAWSIHPRWRLVAAGNRDEFHDRPAAPLARWADRPGIIAGRDLASGGTWMGVGPEGRFAVITNVRGQTLRTDARSRGFLVTAALAGEPLGDLAACNGFSLVTVDPGAARFTTNRPQLAAQALQPGLYGLANAELDAPWPKTVRLKTILSGWLGGPADDLAPLLASLAEEVPDDHAFGSIFIRNPVYGTRCSTVVAVDHAGAGVIVERRFAPNSAASGETSIEFSSSGSDGVSAANILG